MSSDWGLGDIVTATFTGVWADCKVEEVSIHAAEGSPVYETRAKFRVLSITPTLIDTVIAASNCSLGGTASAFWSVDNAKTWTDTDGWTSGITSTLALIEAESGDLFAGTGGSLLASRGEIWRSQNQGRTWTRVYQHATERYIMALVEAANGDLLAGTSSNGKFLRSQDGGDNWAQVGATAAARSIRNIVKASNDDLLAAVGATLVQPEIYRSLDNGATWALVGQLPIAANWYVPQGMVVLANGEVLVGSGPRIPVQICRSQDNGATWANISGAPGATTANYMIQDDEGIVYLGTGHQCKVYRSYDNGLSWLSSDQLSASGTGVISLVTLSNGDLLAGTNANGGGSNVAFIYKSEDYGVTWSYYSRLEGTLISTVGPLLVLAEES